MFSWFPLPPSSVVQALDRLPVLFLCTHPYSRQGFRSHRHSYFLLSILLLLAGDINLNPDPTSSSLNFAHLNIHSASSITDTIDKPALLQEFISDYKLDILALTETWLPPDSLPTTIKLPLTPHNYTFFHSPRPQGRGDGNALLCCSSFKTTKVLPSVTSFEALCENSLVLLLPLSFSLSTNLLLLILDNVFLSEFSSPRSLLTSPSELIITGEFSFHVKNTNGSSAISFLSLLDTFDHTQLVSAFPLILLAIL